MTLKKLFDEEAKVFDLTGLVEFIFFKKYRSKINIIIKET